MPKVRNNSERAITVVDVLLTPGQSRDMPDELLQNPSVQAMLQEKIPGKDETVLQEVNEDEVSNESQPDSNPEGAE